MGGPARSRPGLRRSPAASAAVAVFAALSAFLLPGLDKFAPGGAIVWQIAGVLVGVAAAGWTLYQLRGRPRAWLLRFVAVLAILLVLVWAAGVGVLWLMWAR